MLKIKSNQSGLAHLGLIVVAVVLVAAAGAAVWRVSSSNKNSSGSKVVVNKQVEDACNKAISDTNLCKFAASFNANAAYKATATTTGGSANGTLTIETDGKGNTSLSGTTAGQSLDTITLGNSTYIKDETNGTWLKYTTDTTNSASSSNPADNVKLDANNITNNGTITYKNLGTEACGSLTCYKYQVIDKSQTGTTQYMWFDTKNYQMQKYEVSSASTGTMDMAFTYQGINIATPSPVQDASSSASSSSTPSQADINAAIQAAQNASSSSGN